MLDTAVGPATVMLTRHVSGVGVGVASEDESPQLEHSSPARARTEQRIRTRHIRRSFSNSASLLTTLQAPMQTEQSHDVKQGPFAHPK